MQRDNSPKAGRALGECSFMDAFILSSLCFYCSYHGEPLLLSGCGPVTKKSKPSREAIISTIYDKREEEKNTPLRTAPPRTIKYRDPIRFTEVGSLKEARTLPQQPGT